MCTETSNEANISAPLKPLPSVYKGEPPYISSQGGDSSEPNEGQRAVAGTKPDITEARRPADGDQSDLVDIIDDEQTKLASMRDDELRAKLRSRIEAEGRGAVKRIAEKVGLSRPTLSNFIAGRFGVNASVAALLRTMVQQ
jgi:hypothetical protein